MCIAFEISYKGYNPSFVWVTHEPFAFWKDKDLYKSINDLSVAEDDINKAIHMNDIIDPCRVKTLTNKIFRGEPVKMIVICGSSSAGVE